jgi:hypothetical protein
MRTEPYSEKPKGKTPLESRRRRWENNIKEDIKNNVAAQKAFRCLGILSSDRFL